MLRLRCVLIVFVIMLLGFHTGKVARVFVRRSFCEQPKPSGTDDRSHPKGPPGLQDALANPASDIVEVLLFVLQFYIEVRNNHNQIPTVNKEL